MLDMVNTTTWRKAQRSLSRWRRFGWSMLLLILFSILFFASTYWYQHQILSKRIALLNADLVLITQWHQRYQSVYHKASGAGFFALSDMADSLAGKMRMDGMTESDIKAMSSQWERRQYYLLGQRSHVLLAPIGEKICHALQAKSSEEAEPVVQPLLANIIEKFESGQSAPWCYALSQAEMKELIPPLLWKGENEPSRYLVLMLLPGEIEVESRGSAIPFGRKPSLKPLEI